MIRPTGRAICQLGRQLAEGEAEAPLITDDPNGRPRARAAVPA
jgi:hypothetical protein